MTEAGLSARLFSFESNKDNGNLTNPPMATAVCNAVFTTATPALYVSLPAKTTELMASLATGSTTIKKAPATLCASVSFGGSMQGFCMSLFGFSVSLSSDDLMSETISEPRYLRYAPEKL